MGSEICIDKDSQWISTKENIYKEIIVHQKIVTVLPAYKEKVSIGSIFLLTKKFVDNVIVIDEGSSDRTAEIARRAGAEVILMG